MSKMVNLRIDGKEVKAPEGTTILDAAKKAGIEIPNLCYLKGMRGIGACRLCLVQIEGGKGPVTACTTKAKEGMAVITDTDELREMRRFVLDLIISMHPLDCMTCTKAGVCTLQRYAYESEIKESTFVRKDFGYPVDSENPFIKRDPDYCILCARCVRVCKEQGTNVLDFMGRGVGARVVTANDKPLQESGCTFCGSCIDVCPVNAILEADRWRKGREWEYERKESVCLSCGDACDTVVSTKDNMIMKINAGGQEGSARRYICAIGRFGFDAVISDKRISTPLKRVGNDLQETTWEDALKIASERLNKAGGNTSIISSANILNEDAFALRALADDVIKTDNITTTASMYADEDSLKGSDIVNIDETDLIMLVGLNPSQWERILPSLDASIRRRVSRGAKLIVVNAEKTRAGEDAEIELIGDEPLILSQIAKSLLSQGAKSKEMADALSSVEATEETTKAAELIKGSQNVIIFTSPTLFNASRNLSILKKAGVVAVPYEANARGVALMDLMKKDYNDMISGKSDVLYAIGDLPIKERPDTNFLIVQTPYMTALAEQADLILPALTPYESAGTIVSYEGKIKKLNRAIKSPYDARQHREIFIALSKEMGSQIKEKKVDLKKALKTRKKAQFMPFEKKESKISPSEFIEAINEPILTHSRLLWLKEVENVGV
jgi:NADH dehydrogenase/NADH:ubiquinone oxidoreductase subunit G